MRTASSLDPEIAAQFSRIDLSASNSEVAALQRLLLAVLEDAAKCFFGMAYGKQSEKDEEQQWAERWLQSEERHPFAFSVICECFGIDPDNLRRTLYRIRDGQTNCRKTLLPKRRYVSTGRNLKITRIAANG